MSRHRVIIGFPARLHHLCHLRFALVPSTLWTKSIRVVHLHRHILCLMSLTGRMDPEPQIWHRS